MELIEVTYDAKKEEYIYNLEATDEEYENLMEICRKKDMTLQEFFTDSLKYAIEHPDELKELAEKWKEEHLEDF